MLINTYYYYNGPVMDMNGKVLIENFEAETYTTSKRTAMRNFYHRAKKELGLANTARLKMDERKCTF